LLLEKVICYSNIITHNVVLLNTGYLGIITVPRNVTNGTVKFGKICHT